MNPKMIQRECCFAAKKEGEVLQDDEGFSPDTFLCMPPEADPLPTTDTEASLHIELHNAESIHVITWKTWILFSRGGIRNPLH